MWCENYAAILTHQKSTGNGALGAVKLLLDGPQTMARRDAPYVVIG